MASPVQVLADVVKSVEATVSMGAFWPMIGAVIPVAWLLGGAELLLTASKTKICLRLKALLETEVFMFIGFLIVGSWGTGIAMLSSLAAGAGQVSTGLIGACLVTPAFRFVISQISFGFATRSITLKAVLRDTLAGAKSRVLLQLQNLDREQVEAIIRRFLAEPMLESLSTSKLSTRALAGIARRATTEQDRRLLLAHKLAELEPKKCTPFR